tara:strand:- start:5846 stop:6553 length:708 start_codon:yes stop_codon:yes gene_type:complete
MKILILIITLIITTNLYADLFAKKKINFNSCQEAYETGNLKGEGIYKIKKDGVLQDISCVEDIQLKQEYNYYNGDVNNTLNWEDTSHGCGIDQNENRVAVYHSSYTCSATAKTGINYTDNNIVEIEFNIQRLNYGSKYYNEFIAFGILNYQYLRGSYARIVIGNDVYGITSLADNKIKIIKENDRYQYYLNDQFVAENTYEFNTNNSNFVAMSNNSNIKIYNISVKIYERKYIEE